MGKGGWGKGYHHPHHHHHHPMGKAVAEAALVGGAALAGAAVATAVTRKQPVVVTAPVVVAAAATPVAAQVVVKGKGKGKWKGKGKTQVMEVLEVPPLGISATGIPASAMTKQDGTTYFGIDVQLETGSQYRVQKRYNDFEGLRQRLEHAAPVSHPFPPKHLFSCEGPKLEERRRGLERWLHDVLNSPHSRGLWCLQQLRSFLEVGGGVHTLQEVPHAPMLEPEGQTLQIAVPPGTVGQQLSVTVPDGRQICFVVPPGTGEDLQLWFDPTAGTLTPLV